MENFIITEYSKDFVRVVAKDPYKLYCKKTHRIVSEAIIRLPEISNFKAIEAE